MTIHSTREITAAQPIELLPSVIFDINRRHHVPVPGGTLADLCDFLLERTAALHGGSFHAEYDDLLSQRIAQVKGDAARLIAADALLDLGDVGDVRDAIQPEPLCPAPLTLIASRYGGAPQLTLFYADRKGTLAQLVALGLHEGYRDQWRDIVPLVLVSVVRMTDGRPRPLCSFGMKSEEIQRIESVLRRAWLMLSRLGRAS